MLKAIKTTISALAVLLILNFASAAQSTSPPAQTADNYVTEKGFKSKVFDVKFRDAGSLANALRGLGSGFKGASISPNSEFKTLTVRDFPENLLSIEEALKRLDIAIPARPNIELHMYVLVGSNTGPTTADIPAELKDVIPQLKSTLTYRNYAVATSVVQRLTETRRGLRGKGTMSISGASSGGDLTLPFEYLINSVALSANATGTPTIQIDEFSFSTFTTGSVTQVQTALNMREGEKVVVGTAALGDRALIIVLTAKLVS